MILDFKTFIIIPTNNFILNLHHAGLKKYFILLFFRKNYSKNSIKIGVAI